MPIAMTTYEIWASPPSLRRNPILVEEGAKEKQPQAFEEDSVLVKTFEAASWEEANQVFYEYMGFGKYHPM
jgi:hypothetical protein